MTPALRHNLTRLLCPRHIAFIGGRDAEVAIREAERIGYAGAIWPVNPRRETLGGHACFASVGALPEAPDAVFVAVPAAAAVQTTAELAQIGAGGIVCYSAGFREAGAEGAKLEAALVAAAGDMALVGPNCYGVINYLDRVALWPFAHGGASPGYGAAIITQSGMLSSDITMSQRSLPLTHMISAGNQSVLSLEHFLDHLSDHPAVRAIGVHIEGLRDVAGFEAAALKALAQGVPVVALKTGASQIGAALTVSHTGSLSGTDDLYDALFARTGVIRVRNPAELLETLKFLCVAGAPRGNRIAGFTCSGGGATMLADHAERIGLGFPAFAPDAASDMAALLPGIATVSNPLDYTTPIWGDPARTGPVFLAAVSHLQADAAVLVQDYPAAGLDESRPLYLNDAMAFITAARSRAIPAAICATLSENIDPETRAFLVSEGVAPMQGLPETLNAMRAAVLWAQARTRIDADPPGPLLPPRPVRPLRMLDEAAGKAILRGFGLPVPPGELVSGAEVVQAAARLGYPVALKMMGSRLAHKTEAGAVMLGLGSAAEVERVRDRMRTTVAAHDPDAVTDRFLVERMAPKPVAELIVGLRADPQFGAALTIGSGGVLVELLDDARTLLLPATAAEIGAALAGLGAARLLGGFRGAARVDSGPLVALLCALADRFADHATLAEVEINPLFVGASGCWVVDALIHEVADA